MTVKMFDTHTKRFIIDEYLKGKRSMPEMASYAGCSITTVKRVLEEARVFHPKKKLVKFPLVTHDEVTKIMALCYEHKIDSQKLEMLINEPSLTPDNVVAFLRNSNQRQLAIILVAAGLATQLPTFPIPKDAQMRLIE
jgi:hypothetical protein